MKFAFIMSGGKGKRFWPLSRASRAKQLVKLFNGKTLLELTIERLQPIFHEDEIVVITQEIQVDATREVLQNWPKIKILVEPVGKNTAPCIAYATTYALETHGDCILTFLPADHSIARKDVFRDVLEATSMFASEHNDIVTIGITPDRPATGYGYIEMGDEISQVMGHTFRRVKRFTEKPSLEDARKYLESGRYLWNAGIFCFRASVMLEELEKYLPETASAFAHLRQFYGTPDERRHVEACYKQAQEISIDYAVMEKTKRASVVPADIGWDDLGSWESFSKYLNKDARGNRIHGEHVGIDTTNCIVYSDRQVVASLGISDLTIVVTDDAILISHRLKAEEVRRVVDFLEAQGMKELL